MRDDAYLNELECRSIYIIREAFWEYRDRLAMLWSMGKDSTTLLHLLRKAFFGKVPISVIHLDTGFKFREIYDFREKYSKAWDLDLVVAGNKRAVAQGMSPAAGRFECCHALKTQALKQVMAERRLQALLVGIRRDEHAIRAKERYFSARDENFQWNYRDQPLELWAEYYKTREAKSAHVRIHPLLHWREIDVWRYVRRENLPVVSLYLANGGKRYRSIGCACCCEPVVSKADTVTRIIREIGSTRISERSGRAQDKEKEYMMQKLRSLGYM